MFVTVSLEVIAISSVTVMNSGDTDIWNPHLLLKWNCMCLRETTQYIWDTPLENIFAEYNQQDTTFHNVSISAVPSQPG